MEDVLFLLFYSRWEVYHFAWKICFSCAYNKWSDWSCCMKTTVCLMKEEGTVLKGWRESLHLCRWAPFKFFSSEVQNVISFLQWPLDGRSKNLIGVLEEGKQSMEWVKFMALTQPALVYNKLMQRVIPHCFWAQKWRTPFGFRVVEYCHHTLNQKQLDL